MHDSNSAVAHHFESLEQQHQAETLGMWAFLMQEVMFFGALFAGYTIYRFLYPEAWIAGSHHLSIPIGALNTAVLLGSSFTMAMAVRSAQLGQKNWLVTNLILTLILGAAFVLIKLEYEYSVKIDHHLFPGESFITPDGEPENLQMFFIFYFLMTGCHAFHMLIGAVFLVILIVRTSRGEYLNDHYMPVELMGLYWHFVDIVWIFLFPLLYLLGAHQ